MATQAGWDDFERLKDQWRGIISFVTALKTECDALSALKSELLDNADRRSAMTAIGNQYPGYNMNSIAQDVTRMIAIKALLVANGY